MDDVFRECLEEAVGVENARAVLCALEGEASVSVRLNPSKAVPSGGVCGSSVCGLIDGAAKVPWSPYGRLLDRRPDFTLDPLFHCGAYYVQDSSAMFVGEVVRRLLPSSGGRCVRVLDLCAAPGGKTTDLAASLRAAFGDGFLLVANEVMGDRASVLAENVAKWGDPCVMVCSADPSAFAALGGFFDVIVADVPCSGEGMFRKDEEAVRQWSKDNVSLCAARQKRIVADVWPALAGGGAFVYSTCTFNIYEDDGNVGFFLENLGCELCSINFEEGDEACGSVVDFGRGDGAGLSWKVLRTKFGFALLPGLTMGEGQYCAALRKTAEEVDVQESVRVKGDGGRFGGRLPAQAQECGGWFSSPVELRFNDRNGTLTAVPQTVAREVEEVRKAVRTLRAGTLAGTARGVNMAPSADFALSIIASEEAFGGVEVDLPTALAFLHKDSIVLPDAPKGYLKVLYKGCPLGFVKNLGNRCNNLHPAGRRIRMDVNKCR
ncbi:MAG: rRNA cytosine-C5-methyltransferase [Bacteroidales bacterium]|nr:rRNA cytosine-C5-methyltransferase [Bacteroidales bacterium]